MDQRISRLLDALAKTSRTDPDDYLAVIQSLPEVGELPTPWETWTIIGMIRHRDRQYWVKQIIQDRLRGESGMIAGMGALGHPEGVPQSGSVPGMPEWEYFFHGRGCCLTHKVTGEDIDVDFYDETAEYIDLYFYSKYLESLRNPEPPEKRLLELHRSVRPLRIAVTGLIASGALIPFPESRWNPPRIAEQILCRAEIIDRFCVAWSDPAKRGWIAAMIGDWPAAHEAAVDQTDVQRVTGPRAEMCCAIRRKMLLQESAEAQADALFGLVELGDSDAELKAALEGSPSGLVSAALQIVTEQDNPRWCPDVYSMFKRIRPAGDPPEPHLWITGLKFLLRQRFRTTEMTAALALTSGTEIGEGLLLSLEYAPEHAIRLIRKGLLSDIPCNRTTVAAVLALIARPWSIHELLRALTESDDQYKTADARAALLETGLPEAERAVLSWQAKNPHEAEPGKYLEIDGRTIGPLFSMAEHSLINRPSYVRYEMDTLHDRVMKVKNVVPIEQPGHQPWWQFWRK